MEKMISETTKTLRTIKTKLKFEKSGGTKKLWVGFVSINTSNGFLRGVRENSEEPKKICVVASSLAPQIEANILYDVEMIPMKKKNAGYVVISAIPHAFEARIESCIVPHAIYWVKVKFGNKSIVYNPMDGRNKNVRTIAGCISVLSARKDIAHLPEVIEEFTKAANLLLLNYENDGYYVSKKDK